MSKMTIKDENDGGAAKYSALTFVEFLEYICRIASVKFKDNREPINEKIKWVMDLMLPIYGLRRIKPGAVVDTDQMSDESVTELELGEILYPDDSFV